MSPLGRNARAHGYTRPLIAETRIVAAAVLSTCGFSGRAAVPADCGAAASIRARAASAITGTHVSTPLVVGISASSRDSRRSRRRSKRRAGGELFQEDSRRAPRARRLKPVSACSSHGEAARDRGDDLNAEHARRARRIFPGRLSATSTSSALKSVSASSPVSAHAEAARDRGEIRFDEQI